MNLKKESENSEYQFTYCKYVANICTMNAKEHYDTHLGNFYSWMVGNFDEKQQAEENYFRQLGIFVEPNANAIDLGCGHGLQSISLANLGFTVQAVDFNRQLLTELKDKIKGRNIAIHEKDILSYLTEITDSVDVIVCMGDTLTHLNSKDDVKQLIQAASQRLHKNGKFIVSFRSLEHEPDSLARVIPVKSDEHRIHTCFLEYHSEYVKVFDILHEYDHDRWTQKVSWYPKLRLAVEEVVDWMRQYQLKPTDQLNRTGLTLIAAQKV
jgi:2-polyprenyl-3-methyl-5-hydroxy-6-metoxy-1,4-benzoquinol methylase